MPLPPIIPTGCSSSTTDNLSSSPLAQIKLAATEAGFDLCEITRPQIPEVHQKAYEDWIAAGFHADMAYMGRDPHLRKNPNLAYPNVRSILVLGISYHQGDHPPKPAKAAGRVARYAWGLDYHDIIQERLTLLMDSLKKIFGSDVNIMAAIDTKPLLERSLALSAGVGAIGKNTVLISSQALAARRFHVGSYLFLAELLLDVDVASSSVEKPIANICGSCSRCLTSCPTKAFEGPYRLKADRCISYLTIENKGWIDRSLRPLMSDWIFGCDVCQEVCPFNARAYEARWPEFNSEKGAGPWLLLSDLFSISDQTAFKKRFLGTPLLRAKRRGLLRNACVAAGNSQDQSIVPDLQMLLRDLEPVIRGHALWALGELSSRAQSRELASRQLKIETDEKVIDECRYQLDRS